MTTPALVAVLNGPNLNLLGERQPQVYGHETLDDVEDLCRRAAEHAGLELDFRQTNHEGALVDAIHELRSSVAGLVINAAAYTHTSVAIRDALAVVTAPSIEVHITNVHRREAFRAHSYLSDVVDGVIVGCGTQGYELAIARIARLAQRASGRTSSTQRVVPSPTGYLEWTGGARQRGGSTAISGRASAALPRARARSRPAVRVLHRLLALTTAIWHNDDIGHPVRRSLTASDH